MKDNGEKIPKPTSSKLCWDMNEDYVYIFLKKKVKLKISIAEICCTLRKKREQS